jgi:cytochrome c
MKKLIAGIAVCLTVLASGFLAPSLAYAADDHPTQKDAVAMVERGAAFLKANGKDQLIAHVNAKDPQFAAGELYLIVLDPAGVQLAHPMNPKLVGKAMLDVPDPDGKMFRKDRIDVANTKGSGWVDYKYKNPVSNKIEQKTAYVLKVGDLILTAGVYKD